MREHESTVFVGAKLSDRADWERGIDFGEIDRSIGYATAHCIGNVCCEREHTAFGIVGDRLDDVKKHISADCPAFSLSEHQIIDGSVKGFRETGQEGDVGVTLTAFPSADGFVGDVKTLCKLTLRPTAFFAQTHNGCANRFAIHK